jgi:hypothetical protein
MRWLGGFVPPLNLVDRGPSQSPLSPVRSRNHTGAHRRATFGSTRRIRNPGIGKPLMSLSGKGLAFSLAVTLLTCCLARALDLDQDKSGAQLFAANCATCHRSPKGLAKNRFSWSLQSFLQQHYTTSPALAQTLTEYLQLVDAPHSKGRFAVHKTRWPTISDAPPRPPLPVPKR